MSYKMKLLSLFLLVFISGCLKSPFRTYPDQIWPQRVGNYTYQQCVEEMGVPNGREEINNGFVASWLTFREARSSKLNLTFNSKGILTGWNNYRHY